MATGDNMMDLALRITADPEQAVAAINEVQKADASLTAQSAESVAAAAKMQQGMGTSFATMAQSLRDQERGLQNAAEEYARYGVTGKEAEQELQAAYGVTAAELKKAVAAAYKYHYGTAQAARWSADEIVAQQARETEAARVTASQIQEIKVAEEQTAADKQAAELGLVSDAWMKNAAAAQQNVMASMDALAAAENAATVEGQNLYATAQNVGVRLGTMGEEAETAGGSIFQSFQNLRAFRMLMYSTLGIISFGFYIEEWRRVVDYIQQASEALGGFSKEQQDVLAQQLKFNAQLSSNSLAVLNQNRQNAIESYDKIHQQVIKVQAEIKAAGAPAAMAADPMIAITQRLTVSQFQLQQQLKELQKQLQGADVAEQKANLALAEYYKSHKKATEVVHEHAHAVNQEAMAQQRMNESLAVAEVRLPRLFAQVHSIRLEMLGAAHASRLWAAALENDALRRAHQHQLTLAQMGIALPSLTYSAGQAAAMAGAGHAALTAGQQYQGAAMAAAGVGDLMMKGSQEYEVSLRLARAIHLQKNAYLDLFPVLDEMAQKHQKVAQFEEQFGKAMGQNIAMAIVYGNSIGQAVEKALKASVASIAAEAMVRAIFSTGLGFLMLAEGNFGAAAQAFEAAAVFGVVGGAAAAVGSALPSGGSSHAGAHAGGAGAHQGGLGGSPGVVGSEGPGGTRESGARHQTVLNIYGGQITDTHNLQNVVEALNQGGHAGTVRLNIAGGSHTLPNPVY